ncbi:hypothetical protein AB1L30_19660 [Bremerella sp. JC817]|uniref:hypothetical protein n=1 Tax=Bremerella sp. JC817 TaxID=3231756 RepID=UPI0034595D93
MSIDPQNLVSFVRGPAGALLVLMLVSLGCSSRPSWQAQTCSVTGTARVNGEIPQGLVVRLKPTGSHFDSRGVDPSGVVDETGTYTLQTYKPGDGAPAGEYYVLMQWPIAPTMPVDRLNNAYWNVKDAFMTVTVEDGMTELPPIELVDSRLVPEGKIPKFVAPPGMKAMLGQTEE